VNAYCPELVREFESIGLRISVGGPAEQRFPCPRCSKRERDDSLGVNVENGVFHCFRCGWAGRVGRALRSSSLLYERTTRVEDLVIAEKKRRRLQQTYRESLALTDPGAEPVRQYLRARGLGDILGAPPSSLRAHRGLLYWDGAQSRGHFPAMLALFSSAVGVVTTIHATYLRQDGTGKASVPNPKKILGVPMRGSTRSGAIRLYEPHEGVLGIAEGIENALSLHVLSGIPTWASYCSGNLQHIRLPDELEELHVAVDIDESHAGQNAAHALARALARSKPRVRVHLIIPKVNGFGDLNDQLLGE
jgi:putative DNA primase/helicase